MSFFYVSNTTDASKDNHSKRTYAIKEAMRDFSCKWLHFNDKMPLVKKTSAHSLIPTVLIVADEIFQMTNKQLNYLAR